MPMAKMNAPHPSRKQMMRCWRLARSRYPDRKFGLGRAVPCRVSPWRLGPSIARKRRTYSGPPPRARHCSQRQKWKRLLRIPMGKMKRWLPSRKLRMQCWQPAPCRLPVPSTGLGCSAPCRASRWPPGLMIARRHWTYPSRIPRGLDCCARSRMRRGRRKLAGKMRC